MAPRTCRDVLHVGDRVQFVKPGHGRSGPVAGTVRRHDEDAFGRTLVEFDQPNAIVDLGRGSPAPGARKIEVFGHDLAHLGPCPAHPSALTTVACAAALEAHLHKAEQAYLTRMLVATDFRTEPADLAVARLARSWKRTNRWLTPGQRVVRSFELEGVAIFHPVGEAWRMRAGQVIDGHYRRTAGSQLLGPNLVAEVIEFDGHIEGIKLIAYSRQS